MDMIMRNPNPRLSRITFPPEHPTKKDWIEWEHIWARALGRRNTIDTPLGHWLHESHIIWRWHYVPDTDTLYEASSGGYTPYHRYRRHTRNTRGGGLYTKGNATIDTLPQGCPATCFELPSRKYNDTTLIRLEHTGPTLSIPSRLPHTFWDILINLGGNWMWENLHFDTDTSVEWLLAALTNGGLLWVTDGSHDPKRAPDISGAGWVVVDTTSDRRWACSFYEVSKYANSYRAELLGLYSIHTFIHALTLHYPLIQNSHVKLRCDNKGALRTSSRKHKRIRPTSKCADLLRAFRTLHKKQQPIYNMDTSPHTWTTFFDGTNSRSNNNSTFNATT